MRSPTAPLDHAMVLPTGRKGPGPACGIGIVGEDDMIPQRTVKLGVRVRDREVRHDVDHHSDSTHVRVMGNQDNRSETKSMSRA